MFGPWVQSEIDWSFTPYRHIIYCSYFSSINIQIEYIKLKPYVKFSDHLPVCIGFRLLKKILLFTKKVGALEGDSIGMLAYKKD